VFSKASHNWCSALYYCRIRHARRTVSPQVLLYFLGEQNCFMGPSWLPAHCDSNEPWFDSCRSKFAEQWRRSSPPRLPHQHLVRKRLVQKHLERLKCMYRNAWNGYWWGSERLWNGWGQIVGQWWLVWVSGARQWVLGSSKAVNAACLAVF
jgi:hypothetical protein